MMRTTRDAIESESGPHVFAFAPSSQASRGVLAKEGFKDAETLAMLLKNEKLQEKTKGQILWVDEAGLVSSKDMRQLMDIAKRNGNRVILSGDYTQHSSVEAGDAFRLLGKRSRSKARAADGNPQADRSRIQEGGRGKSAKGTGRARKRDSTRWTKWAPSSRPPGRSGIALLVADYLKAQSRTASRR